MMVPVTNKIIAYQGEPGANSDIACRDVYPAWEPLPCASFEDVFAAIQAGRAELGRLTREWTTFADAMTRLIRKRPEGR